MGSGFEEEDDVIEDSGADAPDGLLSLSSDEAQEEEEEECVVIGVNVVATDKKRKAKDQPGGRNGGYVTYLPLLPSHNTRGSLTRLMKRIYSHPLTLLPMLCNTNIYEKSLGCNSLSVKWSLLDISGSLAARFAAQIDISFSTAVLPYRAKLATQKMVINPM